MNMYDLNQVDKLLSENKTNKTGTKNREDELLEHGSRKNGHVTDKDMQEQTGIRYGHVTSKVQEKKQIEEVSRQKHDDENVNL